MKLRLKAYRRAAFTAFIIFFSSAGVALFAQNQVTLYSPQLAIGWDGSPNASGSRQAVTIVSFINRSDQDQSVNFQFLNRDGDPIRVHFAFSDGSEVEGTSGSLIVTARSAVSQTVTYCRNSSVAACSRTDLQTGWIRFSTTSRLSSRTNSPIPQVEVQVTFQLQDRDSRVLSSVGVPVRESSDNFLLHAQVQARVDVGFAVANPNTFPVNVNLQIFEGGTVRAARTLTLAAGEQLPRFISELFPGLQPDARGNRLTDGSLEVTSDAPVAVVGLRADSGPGSFVISGIPIFFVR